MNAVPVPHDHVLLLHNYMYGTHVHTRNEHSLQYKQYQ